MMTSSSVRMNVNHMRRVISLPSTFFSIKGKKTKETLLKKQEKKSTSLQSQDSTPTSDRGGEKGGGSGQDTPTYVPTFTQDFTFSTSNQAPPSTTAAANTSHNSSTCRSTQNCQPDSEWQEEVGAERGRKGRGLHSRFLQPFPPLDESAGVDVQGNICAAAN